MVKKIDRSDTITNFLFVFLFYRREQDKNIIFVKAVLLLHGEKKLLNRQMSSADSTVFFLRVQYLNINTTL